MPMQPLVHFDVATIYDLGTWQQVDSRWQLLLAAQTAVNCINAMHSRQCSSSAVAAGTAKSTEGLVLVKDL